jgi:hypothetical protein
MRKLILIAISFLLLACSTLSLQDIRNLSATQPTLLQPTPNETMIAVLVQETVVAALQNQEQTPTPAAGCAVMPCPTCAAAEVNSPILPAPPTISVPATAENSQTVSKSAEVPSLTATIIPSKPYQVQSNTPVYLSNFAHQDKACNWMGVAGQVFDLNGSPAKNIVIIVSGKLNNAPVNAIGLTGMTNLYGPGGFEVELGTKPVASNGTLILTVYGLDGTAISNPVTFNTTADCQKNLTLINFNQVR